MFSKSMEILKYEAGKWQYYLLSLAWVVLMIFFTYTAIFSEALLADHFFGTAHWHNQSSLISMFVNCGLLLMIIFDYMVAGKRMSSRVVLMMMIGILFAIGVYGHSMILNGNRLSNYDWPLNWWNLSKALHGGFLLILLWLKERAIEMDTKPETEYVDDYVNS